MEESERMEHATLESEEPSVYSSTSRKAVLVLGMGCFWGPEALFGSMPGVTKTRTGYAGGTAEQPTYRDMGDHSECVEITYDLAHIRTEELVELFWLHHNPVNINGYKGRQYQSLLQYRNEEQRAAIHLVLEQRMERDGRKPDTEIGPFHGFTAAEERHQKYYLKRHPDAIAKLRLLYPADEALTASTLAARLNGLAKGYVNLEPIKREVQNWPVPLDEKNRMLETLALIRW